MGGGDRSGRENGGVRLLHSGSFKCRVSGSTLAEKLGRGRGCLLPAVLVFGKG